MPRNPQNKSPRTLAPENPPTESLTTSQIALELMETQADLALVNRINSAANRGEDLFSVMQFISEEVSQRFRAHRSTLYLITDDRQYLTTSLANLDPDLKNRIEQLIGHSLPSIKIPLTAPTFISEILADGRAQILTERKAIIRLITDFTFTVDLPAALRKVIVKLAPQIFSLTGIQSVIVIPLKIRNEIIGLLDVSRNFDFQPSDLTRLQAVAEQLTALVDRSRFAARLMDSEDKFKYVFTNSPIGKSITLPAGEINVNQAFCQMLGYTEAELRHKKWQTITHPDDIAASQKCINRLLSGQQSTYRFVKRYLRKDGGIIWADVISALRRDSTGTPLYFLTSILDITEQRRAETQVLKNKERLESLLKIVTYPSGGTSQELLDLALEEAIRLTESKIGYLYHYDEKTHLFELNTWSKEVMHECAVLNPQTTYQLEKTGIWGETVRQRQPILINDFQAPHPLKKGHPDGHIVLHKFLSIPVIIEGKIVAVVGVANKTDDYVDEDIKQLTLLMDSVWKTVEQRAAEVALRESEERFRSLYENTSVGLYRTTPDGRIIMANPAIVKMLGYDSFEELAQRNLEAEGFEPSYARHFFRKQVEREGEIRMLEAAWRRRDGTTVFVLESARVVCDEAGNVLYYEGTVQDITERKRAEEALKERERMSAIMIQNLPGFVYRCRNDRDWTISYISAGCLEVTGYQPAELIDNRKLTYSDLIVPEYRQTIWEKTQRSVADHSYFEYEYPIRTARGEIKWIWERGRGIFDENDQLLFLEGYVEDITDRKNAVDALQESESRYRRAIAVTGAVPYVDEMTPRRYTFMGEGILELTGYTTAEMTPQLWNSLIQKTILLGELAGQTIPEALSTIRSGKVRTWQCDNLIRCKDGALRWVVDTAIFTYNTEGELTGSIGILQDITERKQSEEILRQSEARFRSVWENSFDGMRLIDDQGRIVMVNAAFCKMTGKTRAELEHQPFTVVYLEKNRPTMLAKQLERMRNGTIESNFERCLTLWDGRRCWFELSNSVIENVAGQRLLLSVFRDITERKMAEENLRNSEEKFRHLVQTSSDLVWETDAAGRYTYFSANAREVLGYEATEFIGQTLLEIYASKDKEKQATDLRALLDKPRMLKGSEQTFLHHDGRLLSIELNAIPLFDGTGHFTGYLGTMRDLTIRKQVEQETQKIQKLESLGILAGGIAHDFNNLLTGIMGNISLAKLKSQGTAAYASLDQAERAALRAKNLTQQLLTFARGGSPVKETTSIAELIKEAASFTLRGSNVSCVYNFPENLPTVDVDRGQIAQVIQNLVLNAVQAMPEGGSITIGAETIRLKEQEKFNLPAGNYVLIRVIDSGVGIAEKHLARIFDPYFSTKQHGSGLGLSVVYSIIKQHNGNIGVESKLGEGTTFSIYLPAQDRPLVTTEKTEEQILVGSGRILIMDDEDTVREVCCAMLESLGYETVAVINGEEVLKQYQQARNTGQPFDAVIMDLTVPGGMGGKETLKELMALDPQAKALVSSGYSNDPVMASPLEYGFVGVIPKPFRLEEISRVLSRVLDQKR